MGLFSEKKCSDEDCIVHLILKELSVNSLLLATKIISRHPSSHHLIKLASNHVIK